MKSNMFTKAAAAVAKEHEDQVFNVVQDKVSLITNSKVFRRTYPHALASGQVKSVAEYAGQFLIMMASIDDVELDLDLDQEFLSSSFVFRKTAQGHDFWAAIAMFDRDCEVFND